MDRAMHPIPEFGRLTAARLLLILTALFALITAGTPAAAAASVQNENMTVSLEAGPTRGGARTIAIVMTPKPGWHTYWKNPGAAGVESRAEWTLPPGATASDLRYPVPDRFVVAGIMNYVFKTERALLVDIDGLPASGEIGLTFDYLVCDDEICVPESASLSANLSDIAVDAGRIGRWQADQPTAHDGDARFEFQGDRLRLSLAVPQISAASGAYFFPAVDGIVDYNAPQTASIAGDRIVIETATGFNPNADSVPGVVKLMLEGGETLGLAVDAEPGSVEAAGTPLLGGADETDPASRTGAGPATAPTPPLPLIFLAALAGGLLLNIMPCVFPILSLKALSLAKGGVSERAARSEALFYSLGVIGAVLALGGALLALRAGGSTVGWAFQLQDPRIVALLLLLVTAIALNLAGLFELPAIAVGADGLAASGGRSGAFFTGILAAVVATPCTGPFMGAALGAALVLSPLAAMMIFAGLGLGLAVPFLVIGFVPALRRRLPRPGAWMERLRRLLSIPMFVTAVALAWVLGQQAGADGLSIGIAAAVLLGLALWWLGGARRKLIPAAASAAVFLTVLAVPTTLSNVGSADAAEGTVLAAAPYSPAALSDLQAAGDPVFLYFTADWCITCKVNERGALSSAAVADHFKSRGIRTLVGDWTRSDPKITAFLTSHGRAGVPLYIYYDREGRETILPQILSADDLLALGSGQDV